MRATDPMNPADSRFSEATGRAMELGPFYEAVRKLCIGDHLPELFGNTTIGPFPLFACSARAAFTLNSSPGWTRHCCPLSLMTVTLFLLYRVNVPCTSGCPGGRNPTRSPMR